MKYFAELNNDNRVLRVVEISEDKCLDENNNFSEELAIQYLDNTYYDAVWKQTYLNGHIRKNFAYSGCEYNQELDAFIPPKPQSKWVLNETTCQWEPPTEAPSIDHTWNDKEGVWEVKESIILP